ncbi:MAG: nitrate reductase associated protein, partial [Waterburya sp.]
HECQVNISKSQWLHLSAAQRFALIKLSRPSHENKNFLPALQEFGIIATI